MQSLQSHLSVLESSSSSWPHSPAFRIPKIDHTTSRVDEWLSVSYLQFREDVELYARHWSSVLASDGISPRSVVGLWLGGTSYIDVLHVYGLSRAGYIPQLFSLRLPSPAVIFELLEKAGARALIYDLSYKFDMDSPVPTHAAIHVDEKDVRGVHLPEILPITSENDYAFIFHTSGSTSGSPKLVPCSYRWLDAAVSKGRYTSRPKSPGKQDVCTWIGSMCHIGQNAMLLGSLVHGSCTIQPTNIAFSSEELKDMIHRCGLNRLNQFASFLTAHLRNSRKDPELLKMIAGLDEVVHCGLPLANEEELWAIQNGIPLKNIFGSTECGTMLLSIGGKNRNSTLFRPVEGTSYGFFPIPGEPETDAEPVYRNLNAGLLELVILAESGDCPDSSLRHADGNFHTGDLFLEVEPGRYASQGRIDDWIKSENSLRCDTRAIEDNVRATCSDIVFECVVVGNGRPSPALFVEASDEYKHDAERLKKEIIRKIRHFHSRRYIHERIVSAEFVVVVDKGSLPRTATKGNVRRKAVEDKYKDILDTIYGKGQAY